MTAMTAGTTMTARSASDIAMTASERFPKSQPWTFFIIGQVATANIVAQMVAPRNGFNTHSDAAARPPMKAIEKTVRTRSGF